MKYLANRIRTPDGTILQSFNVHDYKEYTDKTNGKLYMVDGGLAYLRRNHHEDAPYEELSVTIEDPFTTIREAFHWGTRGIDGKQPLTWKALKDLDTDHIKAILDTQTHITQTLVDVFQEELYYRDHER